MTEVVPSDRTHILRSKREERNSIARSRKRKLRELFAVATAVDGLPIFNLEHPDAPPTKASEIKFLDGCDILQGRKFNELNIPPRPRLRSDAFRQSGPSTPSSVTENATTLSLKLDAHDASKVVKQVPAATPRATQAEPQKPPSSGARTVVPQKSLELNSVASTKPALSIPTTDSSAYPSLQRETNQKTQSPVSQLKQDGTYLPDSKSVLGLPIPATQSTGVRNSPEPRDHANSTSATIRAAEEKQRRSDQTGSDDANGQDRSGQISVEISKDMNRPVDMLSSPSSTAQTATTPMVLETSTNTSPDRDGSRLEDKPADVRLDQLVASGITQNESRQPKSAAEEVEAQLIRDSANALGAEDISPHTDPAPVEDVPVVATRSGESPHPLSGGASHAESVTQPEISVVQQDLGSKLSDASGNIEDVAKDQRKLPIQPQERARTRVSTGTIRQKSVSEILSGERPKGLSVSHPLDPGSRSHIPITPTSQSPRPRARSLTEKLRIKEKSRLSGVIFGKQPQKPSGGDKSMVQSTLKTTGYLPADDYFTPLFIQGFSNGQKWMKPLDQILHHAHKTVSTPDAYMQIHENQACKVLKRVYQLQGNDKWSLRQPKRCPEPTRQTSHWDVLLQEMKWMRTDFRQERKWKRVTSRNLAQACADWVMCPDDRAEMQVNAVTPQYPPKARWAGHDLEWERDAVMSENEIVDGLDNHATPDLISSADTESAVDHDDEAANELLYTVPPSAIFTLDEYEVVFALNPSPNTDRLLEELPLYAPPLKVPEGDLSGSNFDPDARWKREALPVSKYVEGRMELTSNEPPRKRSRYQYAEDDEDDEILFDQPGSSAHLEPQNPNVALFQPDNKSMRDRLHAGHQFRPPNEHTMPFQTFYESRSCSQWTVHEDDELKALVREYSYNWSLISSMLSTRSTFASGAERRTPWECFERWVMLEGLPHDMQKTQYFKLWQNRIDSAQAIIRQQNANALTQQSQQPQQPGQTGPVTPLVRRRLSLPVKVERRRNQKHLTMIDAMRKLAKKRETQLQKQQHAANLAQMRKQQEQPQPRAGPIKTPREYSIMRWERDQAMAERLAERMAQQHQRAEAQRRAAMQARAQQGQAGTLPNGQNPQLPQNATQMSATHPLAGANRVTGANQLSVNGQARPRVPMQANGNGNAVQGHINGGLVPPMQMNGNGQVQMPVVNGQARMTIPTQPDLNLVLQAQRISEQQRQAVQLRQAQQQTHTPQQGSPALQNSPPAAMRAAVANGVNQKNYMNNAQAVMASFNGNSNSGLSTPPASGLNMPTGQSSSPRPNPGSITPQIHQTYLSQLQHIESTIRATHPNTPQDVVRQMATQLLQNRHNNIAQSAMNAAAGGQGQTAIANGPHQYAQLLRAQQQQQQAQAAASVQAQHPPQQHQRNSSAGSPTPPVPTMPK